MQQQRRMERHRRCSGLRDCARLLPDQLVPRHLRGRFPRVTLGGISNACSPVAGAREEIPRRSRNHAGPGFRCRPQRQSHFYEERLRRGSDGVYRWFQTRARPLRDNRGKIVKWCAVANDIEDRKQAEQLQAELTHASRVSTMGELVASISHELAQPLQVTTANAKASLKWLQRNPPDLTEVRKGTERIMEAGTLASEIINHLRSLYTKAPPKRELV